MSGTVYRYIYRKIYLKCHALDSTKDIPDPVYST